MDDFLPNWEDYARKEEGVQAFYFSGTDDDARDLMSSFPENFVIRTTQDRDGNKISKLCLQDSTTEICILKPDTWIIRDSCGRFYTYDKQFFELAFIKPEEKKDDIVMLAKELYEASLNRRNSLLTGDIPERWEDLSDDKRAQYMMTMTNFISKFVVFRR